MSTTLQGLWGEHASHTDRHRTPPHGVDVMDPTTLYTRPASFYAELIGPKLKVAQMWDEQEATLRGRTTRWMMSMKTKVWTRAWKLRTRTWELVMTRPTEISTCLMAGIVAALILAL